MPALNIFNDDAFSVHSLTAAINNPPEGEFVPTMIDGLFEEEGVSTLTVSIERDNDGLTLVPDSARGAPGDPTLTGGRDLIPFRLHHLPTPGVVMADEVQGVRAMGSESEVETVQALVVRKLLKMRRRLAATQAFHRIGAIRGKIYDANGTRVLLDLHDRFGIQQQEVNFALNSDSTDVRAKVISAKRKAEDALASAGLLITGWMGVCGRGWWDAFSSHKEVKTAFDRWQDGAYLRGDMRNGFDFAEVLWREYYGKVGDIEFIPTNEAYLVPVVSELFITRYGPADYIETVNTIGQQYYGKQEPLAMGKGIALEAQSNPLDICTRPRAVIKLKKQ